jgi:hypothetical protein
MSPLNTPFNENKQQRNLNQTELLPFSVRSSLVAINS